MQNLDTIQASTDYFLGCSPKLKQFSDFPLPIRASTAFASSRHVLLAVAAGTHSILLQRRDRL